MKKLFVIFSCSALLAGCGQLISGGGMPDEMAVVSGPPLTLPPNFELRPPSEQQANRAEALSKEDSSASAQATLMGQTAHKNKAPKNKADWLLKKAGADQANPDIRQKLDGVEGE